MLVKDLVPPNILYVDRYLAGLAIHQHRQTEMRLIPKPKTLKPTILPETLKTTKESLKTRTEGKLPGPATSQPVRSGASPANFDNDILIFGF